MVLSILQVHTINSLPNLRILLIGDTGTGKSTLINNLLGEDAAPTGSGLAADTTQIKSYRTTVREVPIVLYDTPGARDIKASDKKLQNKVKECIKYNKPDLVIFCVQMHTNRFSANHLATLQLYHGAGINWDNTVFALTFADRVKASKEERKEAGFDKARYFTEKVDEWRRTIKRTLVEEVRVPQSVVDKVLMCPTTDETTKKLKNGEEWFEPLFVNVLKVLPPTATFRFLDINNATTFGGNVHIEDIMETHPGMAQDLKEKVLRIIQASGIATGLVTPVAAGVAIAAAGAMTLVLVKTAVVLGAVSCGVGGVVFISAGIALVVIGGIAVCVYLHKKDVDAAAKGADE